MTLLKINKRIYEELEKVEDLSVKKFLLNIWSIELSHPIISEVFRYTDGYFSIIDRIIEEEH